MRCDRCGYEVASGDFCPLCGAEISHSPENICSDIVKYIYVCPEHGNVYYFDSGDTIIDWSCTCSSGPFFSPCRKSSVTPRATHPSYLEDLRSGKIYVLNEDAVSIFGKTNLVGFAKEHNMASSLSKQHIEINVACLSVKDISSNGGVAVDGVPLARGEEKNIHNGSVIKILNFIYLKFHKGE